MQHGLFSRNRASFIMGRTEYVFPEWEFFPRLASVVENAANVSSLFQKTKTTSGVTLTMWILFRASKREDEIGLAVMGRAAIPATAAGC